MDKIQQLEELLFEEFGDPELSQRDTLENVTIAHIFLLANIQGKFLAINENGHFWCRTRIEENNSSGNYDLTKSYQDQKKETKRLLAEIIV